VKQKGVPHTFGVRFGVCFDRRPELVPPVCFPGVAEGCDCSKAFVVPHYLTGSGTVLEVSGSLRYWWLI
jgi:hypothetical protein